MPFWFEAPEGEVYSALFEHVQTVESAQSDIFERFIKLATLYDPHDRAATRGWSWPGRESTVAENVCASNVDTVSAIIARNQPRARFMTDDGDWTQQRTAKRLEWYAEGLCKILDVHTRAQRGFKDGAIKGTGLAKVYADEFDQIRVERVMVDEIVADEGECISGQRPRQLVQRKLVDRTTIKAKYPDFAEAIDRAQTDATGTGMSAMRYWADYRPIERDQVVVLEAWYLPIGAKGDPGYMCGRHVIALDGKDLLDEEWHKPFFPFAEFRWSERTSGYYGIGLVERMAGKQRTLNKLAWQIDRQLDQHAVPTTYVRQADAALAVRTLNRLGTIAVYKTDIPKTVIPPAVSGETYQRERDVKASCYEESGVSRLAASSMKPSGLDSGAALREYKDSTTERFAIQEQNYERFFLDIVWLILDCAKDLGAKAPAVSRRAKGGNKKIRWSDVDMGEVKVQMAAASSLSRTPAGRTQTVIEWAQAGVITQDEARRLLQHPDLERAMSLYTAALEDVERCIEEILDGETLVPEPYQNLKMGVWRMQMAYLRARGDGAPEEILEGLRQWIVQAAYILGQSGQTVPGTVVQGGAEMPPMPGAPPMEATPAAAFAPQAMAVMPQ